MSRLEIARRYAKLHKEYMQNPRIAIESKEFKELEQYFAVLNWSINSVVRYIKEEEEKQEKVMKQKREELASGRWEEHAEAQRQRMAAGPYLDDQTIIVPSDWHNANAAEFWKAYGFHWNPGNRQWERDTSKPQGGKVYSAQAWLTSTRRKFFDEFWPTLKHPPQTQPYTRKCRVCKQKFEPQSMTQRLCNQCGVH